MAADGEDGCWMGCFFLLCTLSETDSSHLKMDGWNISFLLGWPIFRGYISFRECNFLKCFEGQRTTNHFSTPQKNKQNTCHSA